MDSRLSIADILQCATFTLGAIGQIDARDHL